LVSVDPDFRRRVGSLSASNEEIRAAIIPADTGPGPIFCRWDALKKTGTIEEKMEAIRPARIPIFAYSMPNGANAMRPTPMATGKLTIATTNPAKISFIFDLNLLILQKTIL
jgi:hypothetical protein